MDLKKIEKDINFTRQYNKVNTNLILSLSVIVNKLFD